MTCRTPGHRAVRTAAVLATAAACVVGTGVVPVAAHSSFPSSPTFGYQPNPTGGFGGTDVAPPYVSGSRPTMIVRFGNERAGQTYNGMENTLIGATVTAPPGWTDGACEAKPRKNLNDASTQFTNQPGTQLDGWTCAVETIGSGSGAQLKMTWSGPQAATIADSAAFFLFTMTAPTVSLPTRYGATTYTGAPANVSAPAGSAAAPGFYSSQTYASSQASPPPSDSVSNWIPPSDPAAYTTSASGVVTAAQPTATGMIRTVVPATAATGSPGSQTINATVSAGGGSGGELTMSVPNNPGIAMTGGTPTSTIYPFAGNLNPVSVSDTRSNAPQWSVSGIAADFTRTAGGSPIPGSAKFLGWTPLVLTQLPGATAATGVVAGAAAPPYPGSAASSANTGLSTSKVLATAPAGHPGGTAVLGANLTMSFPKSYADGTYGTTLTMTAI